MSCPPQISSVLPGITLFGSRQFNDGDKAYGEDRFRFLPHQRSAFAMIGAPLGMADNDRAGAGIRQRFRRKIAGVGA